MKKAPAVTYQGLHTYRYKHDFDFFNFLYVIHPATSNRNAMSIPNAHPPSSIFMDCHLVSFFSTGYGTCTL